MLRFQMRSSASARWKSRELTVCYQSPQAVSPQAVSPQAVSPQDQQLQGPIILSRHPCSRKPSPALSRGILLSVGLLASPAVAQETAGSTEDSGDLTETIPSGSGDLTETIG